MGTSPHKHLDSIGGGRLLVQRSENFDPSSQYLPRRLVTLSEFVKLVDQILSRDLFVHAAATLYDNYEHQILCYA
jgi:hypothetical protein